MAYKKQFMHSLKPVSLMGKSDFVSLFKWHKRISEKGWMNGVICSYKDDHCILAILISVALHKLQKFYPIEPGNLQDTANCKYQILFLKWLCHEWIKIKTGIIKRIKNTFSKWHDFLELIIIWMKLHDIKFSRMLSFTRNIWCFYWWFHPNDYLRQF